MNSFAVRKEKQSTKKTETLSCETIEEIVKSCGDSFYALDLKKLRGNYSKMERAFKSRYEPLIIGYSYKTNYLPLLCRELSSLGAYAEVVSRLEYDLAVKIGVNPKKIIFNGPLKSENDIETALMNESILNIDSFYEIEYIKSFCESNPLRECRVGLRVNFDLSDGGESVLQEGYERSRFGLCVENGDLKRAVSELQSLPNLKISGLHGHFSTRKRAIRTYQRITKKLCSLAKQLLAETPDYIDIGGGFYGELPASFEIEAPSFEEYAAAVCAVMQREYGGLPARPALIIEPGISLVANTFLFYAKVIDTKNVRNRHFVLVDGSVHNVKPTMHRNNLPMTIIRPEEGVSNQPQSLFDIVGYTCMEKDYLAHDVSSSLPRPGDYIAFENVGAYSIVFNPPFIKERPAIVAVEEAGWKIARHKEKISQFFNEELYCF
ncbi:diaminopimelate decarboxylase [Alteribacillus sp. HJP-4]|uniref:diaminopimelate decarboxylase n=1 Tax=Alteribacillus sp. HJP-4 TaxID=2775394 RepID=UPI0035CD1D7A